MRECNRALAAWVAAACGLAVSSADALTVVHVDADVSGGAGDGTSWADAYADLGEALEAAALIDDTVQVWVAAGTYVPTRPVQADPRDRVFEVPEYVDLFGGFAGADSVQYPGGETSREQADPASNETILSGDIEGDDVGDVLDPSYDNNARTIVRVPMSWTIHIDGFTISAAQESAAVFESLFEKTMIVLSRCRISGNRTGTTGAVVLDDVMELDMTDCVMADNVSVAGGSALYAIDPSVRYWRIISRNCVFKRNVTNGPGGVMHLQGPYVDLFDCRFSSNRARAGGAIFYNLSESLCQDSRCLVMQRTRFEGNVASEDGGAIRTGAGGQAANCTFVGNVAESGNGGAIYALGAQVWNVDSCSIIANRAVTGGAVYTLRVPEDYWCAYASFDFLNCILWRNVARNPYAANPHVGATGFTVGYLRCCVEGGMPGAESIITADPRFHAWPHAGPDGRWGTPDDGAGDLRLRYDSPCIDAGSSRPMNDLSYDITGGPRFIDVPSVPDYGEWDPPVIDIGAYEAGDYNGNGVPDDMEPDTDGDGVIDDIDNCPDLPDDDQRDIDEDGQGDLCDPDDDGDGTVDGEDNCPLIANVDQADSDGDDTGDACDACPDDPNQIEPGPCGCNVRENDPDGDGVGGLCVDLCPDTPPGTAVGAFGCHGAYEVFDYAAFDETTPLNLQCNTGIEDGVLRLDRDPSYRFLYPTAWAGDWVFATYGFVTAFEFQFADDAGESGDIGFAIQYDSPTAGDGIRCQPDAMPFGLWQVTNVMGIGFVFSAQTKESPAMSRLVVLSHDLGLPDCEPTDVEIVDLPFDGLELLTGTHTFRLLYVPGYLALAIDGVPLHVHSGEFIEDILDLPYEQAWVGFATSDHVRINSWSFDYITLPPIDDADNDGWVDIYDNCVDAPNPDQRDFDGDGAGDICDDDYDGDGIPNEDDTCLEFPGTDPNDADGDGVGDMCDECPTTIPGLAVDPTGCSDSVKPDLDRDGDVDLSDFGLLQACFGQNPVSNEACTPMDFNTDQLVNSSDRRMYETCFSGANVVADPECLGSN